jgi:hypothetical protein
VKKVSLSDIVEDKALYPRAQVDGTHVSHLIEALRAGVVFPPVVVCSKTMTLVDGYHRCAAYRRVYGENKTISALVMTYRNTGELFADAVRRNGSHGRPLSTSDKVICVQVAGRLGISAATIANALNIRVDRLDGLRLKIGTCPGTPTEPDATYVPLKMPVRHMQGMELSKEQTEAIKTLGGNNQTFYVNQLLTLIESGLLDTGNPGLMERLALLRDRLVKILK